MSSKRNLQGSFDLSAPMPALTEDDIAIQKILADDMRQNPTPESSNDQRVRLDMEARMREQHRVNRAEIGLDPRPGVTPAAAQRMNAYTARKARR